MFEDLPLLNYDQSKSGWEHIYNGIVSPFATKYKVYIKSELKNRVSAKDYRMNDRMY